MDEEPITFVHEGKVYTKKPKQPEPLPEPKWTLENVYCTKCGKELTNYKECGLIEYEKEYHNVTTMGDMYNKYIPIAKRIVTCKQCVEEKEKYPF